MDNVIYAAVYFGVTLGAFLLGKYVFPNIPKTVTDKLASLSSLPPRGAWIEIAQ